MVLFGGEKFVYYSHVMNVSGLFRENYTFIVLLVCSTGSMMWSVSLFIQRTEDCVDVLYERRDG